MSTINKSFKETIEVVTSIEYIQCDRCKLELASKDKYGDSIHVIERDRWWNIDTLNGNHFWNFCPKCIDSVCGV